MLNFRALQNATLIGTILQVIMVVAGHYDTWIAHGFMFGGMGISLVAGLLYGRQEIATFVGASLGGAIAGGLCGLIGIAVSVWLRDTPSAVLIFGTLGSVVVGLVGGLLGKAVFGARFASAQP